MGGSVLNPKPSNPTPRPEPKDSNGEEEFPRDFPYVERNTNTLGYGFLSAFVVVFFVQVVLGVLAILIGILGFLDDLSFALVILASAPGWTQFLYLPFFLVPRFRKGQREEAKGYILLMVILLLMTSLCASSLSY